MTQEVRYQADTRSVKLRGYAEKSSHLYAIFSIEYHI